MANIWLLVLYSTAYIVTTIMGTFGQKLNDRYYNNNSFIPILFFINIYFFINIIVFIYKYSFQELIQLCCDKKLLVRFSIPSIIYTIESVALYWALTNVPLSIYIIGRTASAYFNVPFSICYLKKKVRLPYYVGLVILIGAYVLLVLNFHNYNHDITTILSIICILLSGFTSALYSNMIEKHMIDYKDNKFKMQLYYNIMANTYGFIFVMPVAFGLSFKYNYFSTEIMPNVLYTIVGISYQIYFLFKILVISYPNIAGNQIAASLDLFRRILTNILAYMSLNEYYNGQIIGANVCMLIGSILFTLSNIKYKMKKHYSPIQMNDITDIQNSYSSDQDILDDKDNDNDNNDDNNDNNNDIEETVLIIGLNQTNLVTS